MELNRINNITTWNDASERLNENFDKIGLAIDTLDSSITHNKGYFASVDELIQHYPTGRAGDKAYVGTNYPYTIYYWDVDNSSWATDNETGGDEDVDLNNYYTKEETEQEIEDYHIVLTQEAYDGLLIKEDKFYYTYEEE